MFLCFFLFAEELLKGTYNGRTVFYRSEPLAIASAQNKSEAEVYIAHLNGQVENLSAPLPVVGKFAVSSRKAVDGGGVLLTCSTQGADKEKYKIFISRKTSQNVTESDLQYFVDLFDNRSRIYPVTSPSASSSPAHTPQRTVETQTKDDSALVEAAEKEKVEEQGRIQKEEDDKKMKEEERALEALAAKEQVRVQADLAAIKKALANMMTASSSPFTHPNQIKRVIQYLEDDLAPQYPLLALLLLQEIRNNPSIDIAGPQGILIKINNSLQEHNIRELAFSSAFPRRTLYEKSDKTKRAIFGTKGASIQG